MAKQKADASNRKLSRKDLAVLIIDALVDAKIVQRNRFDDAVGIAAQEIDVRKALGDY